MYCGIDVVFCSNLLDPGHLIRSLKHLSGLCASFFLYSTSFLLIIIINYYHIFTYVEKTRERSNVIPTESRR